MKLFLNLLAIASFGFLGGCMTMGTVLKDNEVQDIRSGVTTREDLVSTFGSPQEQSDKGHPLMSSQERVLGKPDLKWAHMTWVWSSFDFKALEVWLDAKGKVKDYWFTQGDLSMKSGPKLDEAKTRRIKPGVTTKEGVKELFGEPQLVVHTSSRLLCHGWFYYTKGGFKDTETLLKVVYAPNGKVSKVDIVHDPSIPFE